MDNALASVYGVDLNPFAVAIAKFRLIVAAMKACNEKSLVNAPKFTLNLAAGDSLLHGPEKGGAHAIDFGDTAYDKDAVVSALTYSTEDARLLRTLLAPGGQYDAVVGNPPYITVSDKALNARYREIYHYCKGKYALTVPFMEKFFTLAKGGDRAGWVGQITSNSFMKREFGVPLIEDFLAGKDLRLVADTSGAYIPGHGTPTVIVVGRNHTKIHDDVRAVLGIQGEPGAPENPAKGKVWTSIVANVENASYEDQWVSVTDLPRENLRQHPWSLSGGGAVNLLQAIESARVFELHDAAKRIGVFGMTNCDPPGMIIDRRTSARRQLEPEALRRLVLGDEIRDYLIAEGNDVWFPYRGHSELQSISLYPNGAMYLWPNRTELGNRVTFNKVPYFVEGRPWYEWHQVPKGGTIKTPPTITFAFVATHNHFVLDRGGKVFKQSAPVIKLPAGATEDDHLRLLGTLNSSTACFWLKQNSHDKGRPGADTAGADEPWERRFEFTGTTLQEFPLPATAPLDRARYLDTLAQELAQHEPAASVATDGPIESSLASARLAHKQVRMLMVAEQDELDWETYRSYGLIDDDLTLPVGNSPGIEPGERAFAIVLARRVANSDLETSWFDHHNHKFTPDH